MDIPDALNDAAFPPMLLQPLIENAVKHGLESKIEGGMIALHAQAVPGAVEITVEDDGLGFQGETQSGLGLSNVRERLVALYGSAARLTIEGCEPGSRIILRVPISNQVMS